MLKTYKKELQSKRWDEISIINTETGEFTSYVQHKNIGFPFCFHKTTVQKMGYAGVDECLKELKNRNYLGLEVDYKEQRETERLGYINLGVERIKRASRVCTGDFEDVIVKLGDYGMGFTDAQDVIVETYIHKIADTTADQAI